MNYVDDTSNCGSQAGEGIDELLSSLKDSPEIGYPLYGPYINTVFRGARLKKLYLRSAATGVGKSRSMIADACFIGCGEMYKDGQWIQTGQPQPVLYIATEQEKAELQTMMIAFLSGVNEEHILTSQYEPGEWERVGRAAAILKRAPIYVEELPDFSLKDVENKIKRGIREHGVQYIFHDYLHTSMKILEEITKRSGGVRLREDNILFMIAIRLKDLCNQYGIFIMTATQLNGDYVDAKVYDQNLLRGAKSIADKIDAGAIMLDVTQEDLEALSDVITRGGFQPPDVKMSIYKNRRGRWKNVLMWCKADRGTCRIEPMFVTKYNYELVEMEDFHIRIQDESVF
jgi:replicative DNA helicase